VTDRPDYSFEKACGAGRVAGVDEVGRGALAGPVVAAAVIFDYRTMPAFLIENLCDSKKINRKARQILFNEIVACAHVGIGAASVAEIYAVNILRAALLAMTRALNAIGAPPDVAIIDGNQAPAAPCPTRCIVGGDNRSLSIAAASIVAKITRDALMTKLAGRYPAYGWERNVGYGTAAHVTALDSFGPTCHHRLGFQPVALRARPAVPKQLPGLSAL
jgi:ribonuclease HII